MLSMMKALLNAWKERPTTFVVFLEPVNEFNTPRLLLERRKGLFYATFFKRSKWTPVGYQKSHSNCYLVSKERLHVDSMMWKVLNTTCERCYFNMSYHGIGSVRYYFNSYTHFHI